MLVGGASGVVSIFVWRRTRATRQGRGGGRQSDREAGVLKYTQGVSFCGVEG